MYVGKESKESTRKKVNEKNRQLRSFEKTSQKKFQNNQVQTTNNQCNLMYIFVASNVGKEKRKVNH